MAHHRWSDGHGVPDGESKGGRVNMRRGLNDWPQRCVLDPVYAEKMVECEPRPAEDIWVQLYWLERVSSERIEFQNANAHKEDMCRELLATHYPAFVFPVTEEQKAEARTTAFIWHTEDVLRRRWNEALYSFSCGWVDGQSIEHTCIRKGLSYADFRSLWDESGAFIDDKYAKLIGEEG
jgi:hypothetical protein